MKLLTIGVAFGLVALCASAATAQGGGRPERPYRGLFGGGLGTVAEQSLIFNGAAGGGYDDNILLDHPGGAGLLDPREAKSGGLGMFNGSLSYSLDKGRWLVGLSAGSSSRYYPSQEKRFVGAHNAVAGATLRAGPRTTISGQQAVTYQPYTLANTLPLFDAPLLGQFADPAVDFATGSNAYVSMSSTLGISHRFAQRVTFDAGINHQDSETAFGGDTSFTRQGANANMLFSLTRNLGFRAGYSLQRGRYSSSGRSVDSHNIDVGLDFQKALSFSRRTTLAFSTGTAAVNSGSDTNYRATGSAALKHEMGRTWLAQATYDRSVQIADLLLVPVFQDSLGAGVGGLLHRRVQLQSGVRASIGTIGFDGRESNNDFDTYLASAGLGIALSRNVQVNVDYGFYRYRFDSGIALPLGVANDIDRQTIRVGVGVWAPLLYKARR